MESVFDETQTDQENEVDVSNGGVILTIDSPAAANKLPGSPDDGEGTESDEDGTKNEKQMDVSPVRYEEHSESVPNPPHHRTHSGGTHSSVASEPFSEAEHRAEQREVEPRRQGQSENVLRTAPSNDETGAEQPAATAANGNGTSNSSNDGPQCVVCLDAPATHTFIPCDHTVTCGECAQRLVNEGTTKCIVCRAPIGMVEDPDGVRLERHYFSGLRSTIATQSEINQDRQNTKFESIITILIFIMYLVNLTVCGITLWRTRVEAEDRNSGDMIQQLCFTGLGLSSIPWMLASLLVKTAMPLTHVILSGMCNTLLTAGMLSVGWFFTWVGDIQPWMVFVFIFLIPGCAIVTVASCLGATQALFSTITYWALDGWISGTLRVSCLCAALAFNLNIPLWISIHCGLVNDDMCGGRGSTTQLVTGLMFFPYGLAVWGLLLFVHRKVRAHQEEQEVDEAVAAVIAATTTEGVDIRMEVIPSDDGVVPAA